MRQRAIIFDIDGTLADNSHRQHFIQQEPKDWQGFFDAMSEDKPIEETCFLCSSLAALLSMGVFGQYTIVFCSGRPDSHRQQTIEWINKHIFFGENRIFMRKAGDHRPDEKVKEELLGQMREDGLEPFMVFDDRKRVVEMWRRNGLRCLQVAPGDF